jgi:hypothetical protein
MNDTTYRIGGPAPATTIESPCHATSADEFFCTRAAGHPGSHIASAGDVIVDIWPPVNPVADELERQAGIVQRWREDGNEPADYRTFRDHLLARAAELRAGA